MTAKNDAKSSNKKNDEAAATVVSIEPPLSAVVSMVGILAMNLHYLPKSINEIMTAEVSTGVFTRSLSPSIISINSLIFLRLFFGFVIFGVSIWSYTCADIEMIPPYMRPYSKLPPVTLRLRGKLVLYTFTSMSWNLLGLYFLLASYITYYHTYNNNNNDDSNTSTNILYLETMALVLWKIAAPMTLLIGAVVKYVLWPATLKKRGPGNHNFGHIRPLLQHNANIGMALCELLFMGGIPVGSPMKYIFFPMLFGNMYIFFTWATYYHWTAETHNGKVPATIYFFLDPTLGWRHTLSLWLLIAVLCTFYTIYYGIEQIATSTTSSAYYASSFTTNCIILVTVCCLTCRFRD